MLALLLSTRALVFQGNPSPWLSSRIRFLSVSHQYEPSLHRSLFSSVPKRSKSLRDVDLDVSGLVRITGDSSSGKTTLLKLMMGDIRPLKGSVTLSSTGSCARPIYLDSKPLFGNGEMDLLTYIRKQLLKDSCYEDETVVKVSGIFGFEAEILRGTPVSRLSLSQLYCLRLVVASLQSCSTTIDGKKQHVVGGPILLLDEWLDKETSTVIRQVQGYLEEAAFRGAIVCVVTHVPERWTRFHQKIVLRYGKVVMEE